MGRTLSLLFSMMCVWEVGWCHAQPGYEVRYFEAFQPLGIIAGDFDNDGRIDIAYSNEQVGPAGSHYQDVLHNEGAGYFSLLWSGRFPSAVHYDLVAGFFDSDDNLDIVKPCGSNFPGRGAAQALKGNGEGFFTWLQHFCPTYTDYPFWITTADFNRDRKADVAIAATSTDDPVLPGRDLVSVLLGDGNMGFSSPDTFAVGSRPRDIISGDFDGDRNPDLALALSGEDHIAIYLGKGDGGFTMPPFEYAVGDSPVAIASTFLDGDFFPDIAVVNNKSKTVSVLLGRGDGTFDVQPSEYQVGRNPVSIVQGTFGGNGARDLAVANRADGSVTLLIGLGDGTFDAGIDYAVAPGPRSITAADFNGDNLLDMAVACHADFQEPDTVVVLIRLTTPPTGIEPEPVRLTFSLEGGHPNPFNPTTTIRYSVPTSGMVSLRVYDVNGRLVRVLVDERKPGGEQTAVWDGRDDSGNAVSSGIYFVRLESGGQVQSRKTVLLK